MLRISIDESDGTTATLFLEGHLAGAWIAELNEACRPMLKAGKSLTLDLGKVSHIDRQGFDLLASLSQRAVTLAGCSPFQTEQLRQLAVALDDNSHLPS